ncbi:MAG: SdrD B-like domain-containing protein, partial [Gemmataceae bacterium]
MRSLLAFVKRLFKPTAAQSIRSLLVRSWLGRTSGSLLSRWLRFRRLPIERVERDDARLWARCDSMLLLESRVAPGSVSALAAMPAAMPLVASLGQDRPAFVRASTLERIAAGTTEDRPLLRVATREPRFIRKDDVVEAAPARAASVQQAELAANARFQLSEDPFANPLQDVLGEGREERGSGGLVDGGLEDRASSSAGGGDSYFGTTEQITEAAGGSSGAPLPGDEELALTVQLANAGAFDRFVSLATATSVSGDQVLVIDDLQAFLQGFQQITAPLSPQQGPGTQPPAKLLFPWETPSAADWRFQVRDDDTSRFDVSIGGFEVWISASGTTLAVPQTQGMDTIQKVLALTGQQTATTVITPIVEATFVGAAADAAVTAHGTSEQGAEWLEYHDVFKGIDIIYHSTAQGDLEWSAVVAAGVDPGALVQQFSGASKLEVDAYGNLLIQSSYGTLGYAAPVAFQHIDGKRVEVSSKYVIGAGKTVSFELGAYDASEALIIDPTYYFNGPLPAAGTDEFALPAGVAHAIDIQASPDGSALWVAAQQGNLLLRMDPISGAITGQYAVSGDPTDVWVAGDGKVWFTMFDAGKVGFVDPSTGQVTEYANFAGKGPNAITVTPDGTAWVTLTYAHKLAKITSSGQITELTLSGNQHPIDITHTPDGKLWFTLFTSNKIGRYDPASAVTSFFTVPTGSAQPAGIAVAYDQVTGDPSRIYFTEYNSGKIGWFNLATPNSISEISVGSGTQPYAINLGPDGNIWFAQAGTNKVGRIVNGTILNYTLPAGTSPRGIDGGFTAADPSAGPWVAVTGYNSNEIVILRFDALFAVDDAYEVLQNGTTVPLDVLANDAQLTDQELTIVLVTSGSGTIEVAPDGKSLNYTPGTGFTGSDVFTYTIQDQHGHQDTSTVTVNVQYPGSIAGYVRIDTDGNGQVDANDQGVADRTVDLYRNNQLVATSTTQSDGSYSFIDLFPGTYTVQQQTPTGWTPTTTQTTAIVTSNLTTTTDLGTFQNLIVKGSKYNDIDQDGVWDPGENGLPGWTIQLYTTTGGQLSASPLQTITTDAHGDYSFDDLGPLPAGTSYVVVEVLPTGWIQTYPNASVLDTILLPDGTRGYVIDAASGVLLTAQNGSMQYVTGTGAVTLNGLNYNLTGIDSYNDGAGHAGSINAYLSQFNVTYSSSDGQITSDT